MPNVAERPAVRTIFAPYDSGHRSLRMGAGPDHLMESGLPEMLRSTERPSLSFADVLPEVDPPAEVATVFELDRLVAEQVQEALAGGELPLVLSGNGNTAVGTIAGLGAEDLKTALDMIQERFAIAAAGIASYDPAFDADGRVLAVALTCAQMLTDPAKLAV
jgi:arginase family enzyme